MKTSFFRFTLFMSICLSLTSIDYNPVLWAQSESGEPTLDYTFELIWVPGVSFLELTSTNDYGHYAGNTRAYSGGRTVGFTLIDGVFTTYDVPGSLNFGLYGLNNAGQAVGFYQDANEISRGVIVQNGELTNYDFPGAAETEIFGISETGQLIGDTFDSAGGIHGFVGVEEFDVPGAVTTYADDMNAGGVLVGSYVNADGVYHGYMRHLDGAFTNIEFPGMLSNLEYLFVNAINDAGVIVFRAKAIDRQERTYVLMPNSEPIELRVPGSVATVARDIDAKGQIVGYFETSDGSRHGFIAKPAGIARQSVYFASFTKGLNMLSIPVKPNNPMNARSLANMVGASMVILLDADNQRLVGWTPDAPNDGFPIEGAKGYIVNLPQLRKVAFTGTVWQNKPHAAAPPNAQLGSNIWAYVVSGHLESNRNLDGFLVTVRNLTADAVMTGRVKDGYFAAATANLARQSVVHLGDTLPITVTDTAGETASMPVNFTVTPDVLQNAVLRISLDSVGVPKQSVLLQNYPNPFNPETWIPYHLSEAGNATVSIFDTKGQHIRTLSLGFQPEGYYQSHSRAAYWDGRNDRGERVSSGVYFYKLSAPSIQQVKQMVIVQ